MNITKFHNTLIFNYGESQSNILLFYFHQQRIKTSTIVKFLLMSIAQVLKKNGEYKNLGPCSRRPGLIRKLFGPTLAI